MERLIRSITDTLDAIPDFRESSVMSATFTGIQNENEFYSHHYLSEVFAKDIQATIARWHGEATQVSNGQRPPDQALRTLARPWLQFRQRFARERRHSQRVQLQRDWFGQLLTALGYAFNPANHLLDGKSGDEIPVLCSAGNQHGSPQLLVLGAFDPTGDDEDPLSLRPHAEQFHGETPPSQDILKCTSSEPFGQKGLGFKRVTGSSDFLQATLF